MHVEIPLLYDIMVIFALSVGVLLVCHKVHVHLVVGLLITGILAGPNGLHLIHDVHEVELLAEIGVILLLFTIGLEFSLGHLAKIARSVLIGGGLEVGFTVLLCLLAFGVLQVPWKSSLFFGFLVSLSSTAIVLKLLQERSQMESREGKLSLAVLIFQDIAVVPMMLMVPILAGIKAGEGAGLEVFGMLALKGLGIIVFTIVSARYLVPKLLYHVAKMRSSEIFLITLILLCVAVATLTSWAGLSLALGAFLAGLIISESEYSHQALSHILPFKEVFTSFFFISIGMLLDMGFFIYNLPLVLAVTVAVLVIKALIVGSACLVLGTPLKTALVTGFLLCQIGEFSFILARVGLDAGLMSESRYQLFLSVTVLTMALTPFIFSGADRLASVVLKLPLPRWLTREPERGESPLDEHTHEHLIIVGFGPTGRNLAQAAQIAGIPYVIIELNPETVLAEKAKGEPIFYGDASQESVLQHAGLKRALVLAVAVPDPVGTRQIVAVARHANPQLHIVARTRFMQEEEILRELGANEVAAEEFETSIRIFRLVLSKYLIPRDLIELFADEVRGLALESPKQIDAPPTRYEIASYRIGKGARAVGTSLQALDLESRYQVRVLAIERQGEPLDLQAETTLQRSDVVIIAAQPGDLHEAAVLFLKPT